MAETHGQPTRTPAAACILPGGGRSFIIPIGQSDAELWARGERTDAYICLKAPLLPQAVFAGDLPDLASYRGAVRSVLHWQQRGARFMVYRTATSAVIHHMERYGAVPVTTDGDGRRRWLLPPAGFAAWLARL